MKKFIIVFLVSVILINITLAMKGFYSKNKWLPDGTVIDKIIVEKSKRQMHVYSKTVLLKTYKIALGSPTLRQKILFMQKN